MGEESVMNSCESLYSVSVSVWSLFVELVLVLLLLILMILCWLLMHK